MSEGISDGEVEGKRVAEARHVVVSVLAGVVWCVYANAEVAADYKHAYVEAQSYACAQCEVA